MHTAMINSGALRIVNIENIYYCNTPACITTSEIMHKRIHIKLILMNLVYFFRHFQNYEYTCLIFIHENFYTLIQGPVELSIPKKST